MLVHAGGGEPGQHGPFLFGLVFFHTKSEQILFKGRGLLGLGGFYFPLAGKLPPTLFSHTPLLEMLAAQSTIAEYQGSIGDGQHRNEYEHRHHSGAG